MHARALGLKSCWHTLAFAELTPLAWIYIGLLNTSTSSIIPLSCVDLSQAVLKGQVDISHWIQRTFQRPMWQSPNTRGDDNNE